MRIWHFGAAGSVRQINGASALAWSLAREQARLGHAVTLFVDGPSGAEEVRIAREAGFDIVHVARGPFAYDQAVLDARFAAARPDVVHMHSVFMVAQAWLAARLARERIAYVITPNGGLSRQVLERGRLKKMLYSALVEQRRFRRAAGAVGVSPGEIREIVTFSKMSGPVTWIPNPISPEELAAADGIPGPDPARPRLVFLGRFDVIHKGIDRLVEMARHLPGCEVDLYGVEDARTAGALRALRQDAPANVRFHGPIHGREKLAALQSATLYVQYARWEGFPVSVAEAMYVRTPCALTATLTCATIFRNRDMGLLLPEEPASAARVVREALADRARLDRWAAAGAGFARENFLPDAVARRYVDFYGQAFAFHGQALAA